MATQMPPTTPPESAPSVAARREPAALLDAPSNVRILAAEIVGTAVLMIGGPGSAVLAGDKLGNVGVAFAFGFSLLVMAYVLGHVSGCHINPAVTAGMAVARKIPAVTVPFYVVGQIVGAAVGGFVIWVIASGLDGFDATNNFAQNGWDRFSPSAVGGVGGYGFWPMVVVEIFFTAILVFVVLSTTHGRFLPAVGGVTVGLTLTLIHLVTIPVDNTSVNPARSFGSAIFAGADAWKQLWAFIVFPLIGSLVGVLIWLFVHDTRLEDTALANRRVEGVRDRAAGYVDRAASSVENRMR